MWVFNFFLFSIHVLSIGIFNTQCQALLPQTQAIQSIMKSSEWIHPWHSGIWKKIAFQSLKPYEWIIIYSRKLELDFRALASPVRLGSVWRFWVRFQGGQPGIWLLQSVTSELRLRGPNILEHEAWIGTSKEKGVFLAKEQLSYLTHCPLRL